MDKQRIKEVLEKVVTALDMNDKFGDDLDARHQAEEDAYHNVMSLLGELD